MRSGVSGEGRAQPLLSGGPGYNPPEEGVRKRKTVRGSRVSKNIAQLNTVITEYGGQPIEQVLGLEPAEEELGEGSPRKDKKSNIEEEKFSRG